MPKIKVIGQLVQTGEHTQTNGRTDRQTDGRYQVHNLPRIGVDKYGVIPREAVTIGLIRKWL